MAHPLRLQTHALCPLHTLLRQQRYQALAASMQGDLSAAAPISPGQHVTTVFSSGN